MAKPRLGRFDFDPLDERALLAYQPEADALDSDALTLEDYGLDAGDPTALAALQRIQNRRRDPALMNDPNSPVGARIADLLTGIGSVMQKRSPLEDIGSVQAARTQAQKLRQAQAAGEDKLEIQNLANLARIRQQQASLNLRRQQVEQAPELARERLRQQFEQTLALQSAMGANRMDQQKAREAFEEGIRQREHEFKGGMFEKESQLRKEIEAMRGRRAGERAATAKAEKRPSSDEFKAAGFAKRMELAESDLNALLQKGFDPASYSTAASGLLPRALEAFKPEQAKAYENTKRNFVSAVLRRESGAAISQSEYDNEQKKYFPQVGDTPAVLEQKRVLREQAVNNLKAEGERAYEKIPTAQSKTRTQGGEKKTIGGVPYEKRADGKWYPVK